MSANLVALAYLVASVFFILALKGLSSPVTARRGNIFGILGMIIAVSTTLTLTENWMLILGCIAVGGTIGAIVAKRVQMTAMPELVAFMHSLVGLAAVFIAIAAINNPVSFGLPAELPMGSKLELFLGTFIGAMTWSGSVIAFLKLSGRMSGAPVVFSGQHMLNLALAIVMIGFGLWFFFSDTTNWTAFIVMTAIDYNSYRWCRYAGGYINAEFIFRLGGGWYWFFIGKSNADYCWFPGGQFGRYSILYYVQGNEPAISIRYSWWFRQ